MMKRITFVLIAFAFTLSLYGCGVSKKGGGTGTNVNNSNEVDNKESIFIDDYMDKLYSDRVGIMEYKDIYDAETEELNNSETGKVSFKDCDFCSIPDANTVSLLKFLPADISVDESWKIIKDWLAEINATDIDMDTAVRDADGQSYDNRDESKEGPEYYPAVSEYYSQLESGRGFFINTNRCYLQMGEDGIYSMSDGTITAYLGSSKSSGLDALGANEEDIVKTGSVKEMNDEEWELLSGKVAVKDAADIVKKYFEAGTPYPPFDGVQVDVPEVSVFALKDKYGYAFAVRRIYQGVPFAYGEQGGRQEDLSYHITEDDKMAYVVNDKTVSAFTGYSESESMEPLTEPQDSIISLKQAVSILNEKLAAQIRVKVGMVEFVYCPIHFADSAVWEDCTEIVFPCWEFRGTNLVNNQGMKICLDALTGEIYYYTYKSVE